MVVVGGGEADLGRGGIWWWWWGRASGAGFGGFDLAVAKNRLPALSALLAHFCLVCSSWEAAPGPLDGVLGAYLPKARRVTAGVVAQPILHLTNLITLPALAYMSLAG